MKSYTAHTEVCHYCKFLGSFLCQVLPRMDSPWYFYSADVSSTCKPAHDFHSVTKWGQVVTSLTLFETPWVFLQ